MTTTPTTPTTPDEWRALFADQLAAARNRDRYAATRTARHDREARLPLRAWFARALLRWTLIVGPAVVADVAAHALAGVGFA